MADASPAADGALIDVLVCDDVDAIRMLLGVLIGSHPSMRLAGEARDGDEAVAEARRLQPDVILLDLSMPRRTGFDALPELRQVAPDAEVIVFSGFATSTIAAEVIALGAVRFIEKGASTDVIVAAIEEVAAPHVAVPSPPAA